MKQIGGSGIYKNEAMLFRAGSYNAKGNNNISKPCQYSIRRKNSK